MEKIFGEPKFNNGFIDREIIALATDLALSYLEMTEQHKIRLDMRIQSDVDRLVTTIDITKNAPIVYELAVDLISTINGDGYLSLPLTGKIQISNSPVPNNRRLKDDRP